MKKFKIKGINNYDYTLEDEKGQEYIISLQFYDIEKSPKKGEYIYFSETLLDKVANEGVQFFSFGGLGQVYGKDIKKRRC